MSSLIANDNQPIHKYLRETLAQVLDSDLARAGDDLPLVELGLDSVPCAAWVRLIAQQYGVALSVAEVCECGTLRAVGQRVNAALASRATAGEGRAADEVLACVRHSLAVELDRPEADLEDDTPFLELGLDSITGVTWTRKLNTHFKLSLSVAKVYSHPTLRALAAHIAVSTAKLIPGVAGQEPNGKAPVHAGKAEAAPAPAPAQPGDAVPGDAVAPVAAVLRRLLAQELDADERGIDDAMPFLELGLDSITGVTWMRKINTRFGLALSVAKVYSHSTIAGLAAFIVQQGVSAGPPEATQRPAAAPGARAAPASPASQAGPPALQAAPGPALFAQAPPVPAGIAVIGMSGQFPMADDLEAFWQNILQRKDCVSEVPASRWRIDRHFQSGAPRPGKSYSKWMGVLDRAAEFDPLFFNISPAEAQFMDPQQRLVLQQSWHCIEDAGGDPDRLAGTACGVFLGCSSNGYGEQVDERDWNAHQNLGSNSAILASRIAYFLNLRGPCLSIDTSCSSSLVAIASACDSLLLGESEVALAGGVWVIPGPGVHVAMSQLNALSPDGRCRAFDDRANGFVPAEGVGFLMLKRLSDAQRDGDRIHAVIAGWGVNQDGKSNGITAPNGDAQAALQERVYRRFGIDLADIDLVEAHGTGTSLGDPVEVDALTASFRRFTPRVGDCALGSVKSNIGHTASAAGVASALKVILALKHRVLPPTALFERMNPHIDLSSTPFRVQAGPAPWAGRGRPRMGVVNSFGYSGTNAHLVIAEAPLQPPMQAPQGECLVVLSARTAAQLKEQAQRLSAHLERHADVALGDLAHTLLHGRKHWRHRLAVVAGDLAQLQRSLRAWLDQGSDPAVCQGEAQPGQSGAAVETPGLSEAAQQYVRGASLRWEALFPHGRQRLLSLPGYPFSRERHWLPLHPLLHRDESTASQARFSATFDGTESFLDHHRVQGEKVLPGAAYLEMAREAVARVHGEEAVARMQLQDLVWLRPATCRAGLELAATLTPQAEGLLGFEVTAQGGEGQPLLLCQARVRLDAGVMPRPVDLQALRERCREPLMPAEDFYALYAAAGMAYGPAHRSVVRLLQGRGAQGQPEVLAEIALPATVQGHRHGLHPSLVDGALQATVCLGWTAQSPAASQPALPFALGGLQVLGATPSRVYAWIRPSTAGRVSGAVHKLDISLCDEQGRLCAELSGLSVRALARGEQPATGPTPVSRAAVPVAAAPQVATASGAPRPAQVGDRALHYFRQQLAVALKLSVGELDVDAPMERYGMDSIMAMELTRHLEESFGPLPKTLFFEVQTPRALAEYFVAEHPQVLQQLLGEGVPVEPPALPAGPVEWPDTSVPAPQAAWTSPAPAGHADIAVVGIGGRYPQAPTLQQFWENLRSGRDCITEVPAERWDHGLYFDPDKGAAGKSYCKWGGFIEGVDEFDPLFFNISPREAEYLDPQERLFLQCVHETLEDAGYTGESLGRQSRQAGASQLHRVGVFVGVMYEEYQLYGAQAQARGQAVALAGSPSSIANRISYFFNFHGPSMAVDTMCSSSLTSIHLACMAIRSGQCDAAIAGGVNVTVHPNKYLMLSQGRFASSLGRCGSFGAGGDGYVPGEGVGALLLKPRERALADGDHILGVIRGSALNHGGKTNGVSVPSLVAQGQVIAAALREAGVSPAELSYIEAHGTGTSLGDPIEIAGLMKVFQPAGAGQPAQRCAIGSVKSSIGHCESAAGVAGVTKVLLQMQHRQLVPSLHSQTLNPHIDFDRTPFAVQQQLQPWEPPVRIGEDGQPVACRRIAGVSSFGAGGSNAHVIIEEHVEDPSEAGRRARWQGRPAAIVLSAQDARALVERARRLLARLPDLPGDALHDLAFTLQVGRDAMKERLAFVVGSLQELAARLQAFVDEPQRIQGIAAAWRGTAEAGHEAWSAFAGDEELQEAVHKWLQRGKYEKLLNLWVQGLRVDWLQLYGPDAGMRRLSLPGYPFAKERCWFEAATAGAPSTAAAAVLHPLLHRNDSTAFELRFSSTFDGSEPFLRDHVVNGQRVLPGVAHLEMGREAMARCLDAGERSRVTLSGVTWLRPAIVTQGALALRVKVQAQSASQASYQVLAIGADGVETLCSQGQGVLASADEPAPGVDLVAVRAECADAVHPADAVYALYAGLGLAYGPAQRAIRQLAVGKDGRGRPQALAVLALPSTWKSDDGFGLHPSLLDGALQATIGLVLGEATGKPAALPFAIDHLAIHAPLPHSCLAWVRLDADAVVEGTGGKVDITLCDEAGRACLDVKGLVSRPVRESAAAGRPGDDEGLMLMRPVWEARPLDPASPAGGAPRFGARHVMVVGRLAQAWQAGWRSALGDGIGCDLVDTSALDLPEAYQQAAVAAFERVKVLLQGRPRQEVLLQLAVVGGATQEDACFGGLAALLRSAAKENPKLVVQSLLCMDTPDPGALVQRLADEAQQADEAELRIDGGVREVRRLASMDHLLQAPPTLPWREGGVYLVTGGTGGLGLAVAESIARSTAGVTLVLTARSAPDDARRDALDALRQLGAKVEFLPLDVCDGEAVHGLVHQVQQRHGALAGVVHAAGVLRDNFVIRKSAAELQQVLAPKVQGLVHLDRATAGQPLDFLVCFSSMTGLFGNAGQADYSAANAFMDAYAAQRNRLAAQGLRQGVCLSVNWPLWAEGGMRVDETTLARIRETGLVPLQREDGLRALAAGLQALSTQPEAGQLLVVPGRRSVLSQLLAPWMAAAGQHEAALPSQRKVPVQAPAEVPMPPQSSNDTGDAALLDRAVRFFRQALSQALKLDVARIDPDTPLERYGMDSVIAMNITGELEKTLGPMSKTLFFEVQTLRALAEQLLGTHREALAGLLGQPAVAAAAPAAVPPEPVVRSLLRASPQPNAQLPAAAAPGAQHADIAVVGVAGRYPHSATLERFWHNLRDGVDCIDEVPAERWDHRQFLDDDRDAPGKTYGRWGGFLEGVDQFDPLFFQVSPREAEAMDPQQRLFLETVWELFEGCGVTQARLEKQYARRVGVYVGAMYQMYRAGESDVVRHALTSAASFNLIANRVSYFFGLEGASVALDTMCSSSTQAIHQACVDLARGDCLLAVAGGVNLTLHPDKYLALGMGQLLGSSRQSRSFLDGDGYLPSEGVGAVLLKPLAAALRDGDPVLGVIKGSASLHGGRANRFMNPSFKTQVQVIERCLERAGAAPQTIGYIEAAANGSALGDSIELRAMAQVFGASAEPVLLGSVKSNVGHPESASGIAQLTKVLLQLKHGQVAPLLLDGPRNPNLDLAQTPLRLCERLTEWRPRQVDTGHGLREVPQRALINSVGAGGSHVCLVVEAPPALPTPVPQAAAPAQPQLIVLSAKTATALRAVAQRLLAHLQAAEAPALADVACTLQVGREALACRLAFVAASVPQLCERLQAWLAAGEGRGEPVSGTFHAGHAEEDRPLLDELLSGPHAAQYVAALVRDADLARLGAFWAKGGAVPWDELLRTGRPVLQALPTYPFERRRCWLDSSLPSVGDVADLADATSAGEAAASQSADGPDSQAAGPGAAAAEIERFMAEFIASTLGVPAPQVPVDRDLQHLGVDSIVWARLQRAVHKRFGMRLSARDITEANAIAPLSRRLVQRHVTEPDAPGAQVPASPPPPPAPEAATLQPGDMDALKRMALERFKLGQLDLEAVKNLMNEGMVA